MCMGTAPVGIEHALKYLGVAVTVTAFLPPDSLDHLSRRLFPEAVEADSWARFEFGLREGEGHAIVLDPAMLGPHLYRRCLRFFESTRACPRWLTSNFVHKTSRPPQ
jgi:hypothetical protein